MLTLRLQDKYYNVCFVVVAVCFCFLLLFCLDSHFCVCVDLNLWLFPFCC